MAAKRNENAHTKLLAAAAETWRALRDHALLLTSPPISTLEKISWRFQLLQSEHSPKAHATILNDVREELDDIMDPFRQDPFSRAVSALSLTLLQERRVSLTEAEADEASQFLQSALRELRESEFYAHGKDGEPHVPVAIANKYVETGPAEKICIRFGIPDSVDSDVAAAAIAEFYGAVSALHVAMGGSGLKVDEWFKLEFADAESLVSL